MAYHLDGRDCGIRCGNGWGGEEYLNHDKDRKGVHCQKLDNPVDMVDASATRFSATLFPEIFSEILKVLPPCAPRKCSEP